MAIFKRKELKDEGFTDEQIEYLMSTSSKNLTQDYVLKVDVQAQIDEAVAKAQKPDPIDVKQTDEYKALLGTNQKLTAFQTDDFKSVKSPYRDIVWDRLDHGENHKAYAEQIGELAKSMPDLFVSDAPKEQEKPESKKPTFGAPTQGSMPSGEAKPSISSLWGYGQKK